MDIKFSVEQETSVFLLTLKMEILLLLVILNERFYTELMQDVLVHGKKKHYSFKRTVSLRELIGGLDRIF